MVSFRKKKLSPMEGTELIYIKKAIKAKVARISPAIIRTFRMGERRKTYSTVSSFSSLTFGDIFICYYYTIKPCLEVVGKHSETTPEGLFVIK